ncbi:MAG: ribonuclease III [Candidatus Levybacteria bacterium CG10_big_fil_rev_8_21_14_0_10_36_7]|nr:MAG: ribonuclease III [Candidatus Levybacteria bacterium CG10_big_fil_rev_8_21_14_0_10_36_7]
MKLPEFKDSKLFEKVFIHRSYLNEGGKNMESNERIEFLGDSILSFIVSSYVYENYPEYDEGKLTSLRSVLTNTETLALVSGQLGLGEKLKLSKGEESNGGRKNKTILANTYEAVLGGIFLDQGLEDAADFVKKTIIDNMDDFVKEQGLKDPKSKLQERLQEIYKNSPVYKIESEEGPDHERFYTVGVYIEDKLLAKGKGKSKQIAEKVAAKEALSSV